MDLTLATGPAGRHKLGDVPEREDDPLEHRAMEMGEAVMGAQADEAAAGGGVRPRDSVRP